MSKIYFHSLRGVATPNPLLMMAVTLSDTLGDLDVIERERERERGFREREMSLFITINIFAECIAECDCQKSHS